MKSSIYIFRPLIFGVVCACIAWYAGTYFESNTKVPNHDHYINCLNDRIQQAQERTNNPNEEMYKLGYLLYKRRWFNEADPILRFVAKQSGDDARWFDWKYAAKALLLSDDFQSFYESEVAGSNLYYPTDIEDEKLFDKESVRRKYGKPSEITADETSAEITVEKWIYFNEARSVAMEFEFQNGRLTKMIPGGG